MTTHEHKHHWRAYGQQDGTVVCDDCDCADDVNQLINQARKEAAIEELERLKHFDSFNEPYTWQGDERPGKLVDIRIKALKEGKQ